MQITDPYALSKRADEATADMVDRRYGTTVVALCLPFVGAPGDRLGPIAELRAAEPGRGAADGWSYLDVRDAARALIAALRPAAPGSHVRSVAAPETLSARPTEWLLDRFHPGVPRPASPDVPCRSILNRPARCWASPRSTSSRWSRERQHLLFQI